MAPVSWTFTTATRRRRRAVRARSGRPPPCRRPRRRRDTSAVELGVKFRTTQAGFITGIRFYKGTGNTGTHVGKLWTSTGTLLATVTFTGETATRMAAGHLLGSGRRAGRTPPTSPRTTPRSAATRLEANGLAAAVTNGPLTALASGVDGGNGVYAYGAGGVPDRTPSTRRTTTSTSSSTPPSIDTTPSDDHQPGPGQRGDRRRRSPRRCSPRSASRWSASTVNIVLTGPGSAVVPGATSYDAGTRTATFTPTQDLAYSTAYQVNVSRARPTWPATR